MTLHAAELRANPDIIEQVEKVAFRFRRFSYKMRVQCQPPPPTGGAALGNSCTTWKPNWNSKSPPRCKPPYNRPGMLASRCAASSAGRCTAAIAAPALLPPATAKSAGNCLYSADAQARRPIGRRCDWSGIIAGCGSGSDWGRGGQR